MAGSLVSRSPVAANMDPKVKCGSSTKWEFHARAIHIVARVSAVFPAYRLIQARVRARSGSD